MKKTKQSFLAQKRTTIPDFHIDPEPGVQWHSFWPKGMIEANRRIYDYELIYFHTGSCRMIFDAAIYTCLPGTAIIIPPNLAHCSFGIAPADRWCVHFDWRGDCPAHRDKRRIFVFADSGESFEEADIAPPPELPGIGFPFFQREVSEELLPLLQRYFRCCGGGFEVSWERRGLLLQILGTIFQGAETPPSELMSGRTFLAAKRRLDAGCLDSGLQLAEVAGQLKVSVNYLTKLFRKVLGMSAIDYLHMRRLEHGRKLLLESDLTVREIAFASGFNDANYFTRFFRKRTGQTPGELRRGHSELD